MHDQKAYMKEYYKRNRDVMLAEAKQWQKDNPQRVLVNNRRWRRKHKAKLRRYLDEIKASGCSRCGEKDLDCLCFHHVNPGKDSVSVGTLIGWQASLDRIKIEVKKCVVICRNCHIKIHKEELDGWGPKQGSVYNGKETYRNKYHLR